MPPRLRPRPGLDEVEVRVIGCMRRDEGRRHRDADHEERDERAPDDHAAAGHATHPAAPTDALREVLSDGDRVTHGRSCWIAPQLTARTMPCAARMGANLA